MAVNSCEFSVDGTPRWGVLEVGVPRPQLVGALAREDHLDVARGSLCEEPVRHGRPDELGVVGLHMIDDRIDDVDRLVGREDALVVVGPEDLGHGARRHQVRRVLHAHRVRRRRVAVAVEVPAPLDHELRDDARVDASREEQTKGDVGHHSFRDGLVQSGAHGDAVLLVRTRGRERLVRAACPRGVVVRFEVAVVIQRARGHLVDRVEIGDRDERFEF
mmetsp:Transcript_23208/g.92070  ORF Transcript_23208/g.92070 Transcript_23208/m.92070 type:complete len:218 (-) Transcript_23208:346-999(-)